jgi:glycerol 3-phosphatase-2
VSAPTLLSGYDGLLLDLDGVVYVGPDPVPHAVASLREAAGRVSTGYVTNNASRPASAVAEHLRALGLELDDDQVVTSAQVAATIVRRRLGEGARVLAVGGPGVGESLRAVGLEVVTSAEDHPRAVVQGYGPDVAWTDLAEVAHAVNAGAWWVATNRDLTIPTSRGIAPGNGTLVRAVRAAVEVDPDVAGKPEPVAFTESARAIGARRPLVVGDRIDTDIEGAVAAGVDALLVLTGVHHLPDLVDLDARSRPTHVGHDLRALHVPALAVQVGDADATCAGELVRLVDGVVEADATVGDRLAAAWAGLTLIWATRDAGGRARPGTALADLLADPGPALR